MEGLTNWPEKSGVYKIVQMEVDGKPCIRFPIEFKLNHGYIITELADLLERYFPKEMDTEGNENPSLAWDWYKVYGAGKARIDAEEKQAALFGESKGYGIGIDLGHLERVRPLNPDWVIIAEI
jgi:hypothetical protein